MTTESDIKTARYREVVKEVDIFGRIIGVRRLRPSERARVLAMTSEFTGYYETVNEKGEKQRVPQQAVLLVVASVSYISDEQGEIHVPFPRNIGELYAMYDRLDDEGMLAASKCMSKLLGVADDVTTDKKDDPLADSKNLSGTSSSA